MADPTPSSADDLAVDLPRSRWDGVLTPEQVAHCRARGLPLAYDCAQIGWVLATPEVLASEGARGAGVAPADNLSSPAEALRSVRARFERDLRTRLAESPGAAGNREILAGAQRLEVARFAEVHGLAYADALHWALTVSRASLVAKREAGSSVSRSTKHATGTVSGDFSFRPWTLADLPVYAELLRNPRVWRYLPEEYPEPFTDETARGLMEVGLFGFLHETVAVERAGRPIGQCLFRPDTERSGVRAGEVAYWLGEDHWGKGYMSRILPLFTARCFRTHPVDVMYAWIREDHRASRRVAERAGYRRDTFPPERALAAKLRRPGFVRYAILNPALRDGS